MFGASWRTSALGYVFALMAVAHEWSVSGSALPHTVEGWVSYGAAFIVAVMGRVARDGKVSSEDEHSH